MRGEILAAFEWIDALFPRGNKVLRFDIRTAIEFIPPILQADDPPATLKAIARLYDVKGSIVEAPDPRSLVRKPVPLFPSLARYYDVRAAIVAATKRPAKDLALQNAQTAGIVYPTKSMIEDAANETYDCREKVGKLGITSTYGKLAQGIGGSNGRAPATSFPWAAAAVSAGARAMLIRAAVHAPSDMIYFATHGILSTSKLDIAAPIKTLGLWEEDKDSAYSLGIIIGSGLYAGVSARGNPSASSGQAAKHKRKAAYRGIRSPRSFPTRVQR